MDSMAFILTKALIDAGKIGGARQAAESYLHLRAMERDLPASAGATPESYKSLIEKYGRQSTEIE